MNRTTPADSLRTVLHDSVYAPLHGEQKCGATDRRAELQITLLLRRRRELPDLHSSLGNKHLQHRKHLTHEAFTAEHGAIPSDIALIERFARNHRLELCKTDLHRRAVVLKGSAAAIEQAFDVNLVEFQHSRANFRAISGAASVPNELSGIVCNVLGLNTRPCARRPAVHHPNTVKPFWTVRELADAYGFPQNLTAQGQTIALIELGGGYHEDDLRQFFHGIDMPMPSVRCVSIDGVRNSPAPVNQIKQFLEVVEGKRKLFEVPEDTLAAAQGTVEVTMDIELAAAFAPGAQIIVYMAPPDEQGIYNAVSQAIGATENLPCALSISWGEPETGISPAYLHSVDEVLRDAAMLGVTICTSSGDEGAMNGSTDGQPAVNFPSSSPHVLSCGGSRIEAVTRDAIHETAWNCTLHGIHGATGGGISRKFKVPSWQQGYPIPSGPTGIAGRGVPDVAGPADPHRGCEIIVGGESCSSAGTSAVAPLWAALIACINARLGVRSGFITPLLYELSRPGAGTKRPLRDIIVGNNGFYDAGPGWNACTGLGSPIVDQLIGVLKSKL
ncbi:MAG TPA: S53 family peptidase [Candidatus Saccharimonadales bacterium]|nr:S53 family peptidase [Candidatus Saccharimonadales bacterium]